jgi:ubiquinone/menaquinone biosynthesis C-methylase UbiE
MLSENMNGNGYKMNEQMNVGYDPISDIGLLKRSPLEYANISNGMSVLNLGSGNGDDAFAIRRLVGDTGRVIGIDESLDMVSVSRQNAGNIGYTNVTFFERAFDRLLFEDNTFDVIIGSERLAILFDEAITVMEQARRVAIVDEIHRILKPNGRFLGFAITPESELEIISHLKNKFSSVEVLFEDVIDLENGELLLYMQPDAAEKFVNDGNVLTRRALACSI